MTDQKSKAAKQREAERRSALVQRSPGLMPYGTPEELIELVRRFKYMVPGGDRLSDNEVTALAQAAYIHGLNPLLGEIWWIGSAFPGIRGLRRKGREQLERVYGDQGMPDLKFELLNDATVRDDMHIPDDALAYQCSGTIPAKRHGWVEDAKTLREALGPDAPYQAILENIGPMPVTVGVGYISAQQMAELDNPRWYHKCGLDELNTTRRKGSKGGHWMARELRGTDPCGECQKESYAQPPLYPHDQRARKRAEAHWWKQECDLPWEISRSGAGLAEDVDVIDVEFTEVTTEPEQDEETGKREEPTSPAGVDQDDDENGPRPPSMVKDFCKVRSDYHKAKKVRKHPSMVKNVAWQMSECFAGKDTEAIDIGRQRVLLYLWGKPSTNDLTGAELLSMLDLLAAEQGNDKKWHPNILSAKELRAIASEFKEVA